MSYAAIHPVFGEEYRLHLFSSRAIEDEQWIFFTPEKKAFSEGPGCE